ncbi:ECEL1 protein, partial [Pseudoatta argentina]
MITIVFIYFLFSENKESVYSVGSQNHLVPIKSRKTFFKKKSQISNLSLIILFVLVGALSITVVILAVLYACKNMMEVCDSEDCIRIAASLKESMNESVDPCDDFYQDKELEKRLQTIRSRLQKLDELDEAVLSENEEAEFTYMVDVIKHIINNGTDNKCTSDDELVIEDEELIEFFKRVYNISNLLYDMARANQNQSISIDSLSDSDYMLVDDLQKLTDDHVIDSNLSFTPTSIWRPFIESIFEGIDKLDLDNKDKVLIGNLEYLKDVAVLLACLEEEVLESYIWWTVEDIVAPYAFEKLRDIWNKYVSKITDMKVIDISQSLFCGAIVNKLMGMAVSWLFVDPTFHENKVNKVQEMLEDIREAFGSLVAKTDWMDQSTKTATIEKSKKMEDSIGFPTWLFNKEKLAEYYKGIDLSETRYLTNLVQFVQVQLIKTWASLHNENIFNKSL